MKNSYIHIYTGNGKGKTTAALGLALRASCAGKKVYIGQFVKGMAYSEFKAMDYLPNLTMELYGRRCFIEKEPEKEDIEAGLAGLERAREILNDDIHDLVILDELNIALYYKLFPLEEVIDILKNRKEGKEVVITGRYAPQELIDLADLVTEMKEVKHYYSKGVEAREGIEF